jgi:hypothetical protein
MPAMRSPLERLSEISTVAPGFFAPKKLTGLAKQSHACGFDAITLSVQPHRYRPDVVAAVA